MLDTRVLIVSAGPLNLTLAINFGQRAIRCVLIEKKDRPAFLPKMEREPPHFEPYQLTRLEAPSRATRRSWHQTSSACRLSIPSATATACSSVSHSISLSPMNAPSRLTVRM